MKGISALTATVLIIALVIAVAGLVGIWFTGVPSTTTFAIKSKPFQSAGNFTIGTNVQVSKT
jgi:FlaG/FlaF family flagellin (archaellin)